MAQSSIYSGVDEFRLVDVDGVILTNPGDFIRIREPDGFDELQIVLERDGRGGFDFEYGEAESRLGFDGFLATSLATALPMSTGRYLTEEIFAQVGSDMNVRLQYFANGNTTTPIYEGFLIGSSRDDRDYITFYSVERLDFGGRLKTRFDKVIDLEATTNFDNGAFTPPTLRTTYLHSQSVLRTYSGQSQIPDTPFNKYLSVTYKTIRMREQTNATVNNIAYWVPNFRDNSIQDIDDSFALSDALFAPTNIPGAFNTALPLDSYTRVSDQTPLTLQDFDQFIVDFTENEATVQLSVSSNFDVFVNRLTTGTGDTWASMTMLVGHRITIIDQSGEVSQNIQAGVDQIAIANSPLQFSFTENVNLSFNSTINIRRGDKIYHWIEFVPNVTGLTILGPGGDEAASDDIVFEVEDITDLSISLLANTKEQPTPVEFLYFNEALEKALESVTGVAGLLESTVFQNRPFNSLSEGCGGLNNITTGFKIRQRDQNLRVTIDELISFARARYGCDFAIYYDSLGNPSFLLEKDTHFFQDKRILTLTNIHSPVVTRVNTEILANEIKVGFSKFARPNETGTSEGFSTQTDYLTPIQKDEKTLNFISDVIGDGTEIERVRRNGIRSASDESDQRDDDPFVIKMQEFGGTSFYSPALYGSGDDLNIQRDATNNRIIVNGLIINDVQQNDYINISGQTNRQIDGVPVLDVENNRTILPCSTETQNDTIFNDFNFRQSDNSSIRYTYNAERLEGFSNVTGLVDPGSTYNIDHANTQFLFNNFQYFGGSLIKKPSTDEIRFLTKKAITTLQKQYDSSTCGLTQSLINERSNFTLQFLIGISPEIFTDNVFEVTAQLTFTDLIRIKEAVRNESTEDINYGFIEFTDNEGRTKQGFPMRITYNPVTLTAELLMWEKADLRLLLTPEGEPIETPEGDFWIFE